MDKDNKNVLPFFSVIVAAYNCEKYISKCLDSIINQSYSNWEAIVVNDGSKDKTLDILTEYERKDIRIKVISKENGGVSSARNVALNSRRGKYILFLDSDDWYELDYFETLYDILRDKDVDVVFSTQFYFNESQLVTGGKNAIVYPQSVIDLLTKFTYSFAMTCVKSDLITGDIRYNENLYYYEDGELMTRILALRPSIVYNEKPSFHYRQGSITHTKFTAKTLTQIEAIQLIDKRFRGVSKEMDAALNQRYSAVTAGMATFAAKDRGHDTNLDNQLMRFSRKHIFKVLFSHSKITFIVKSVLVAISPRIAYKIINLITGE